MGDRIKRPGQPVPRLGHWTRPRRRRLGSSHNRRSLALYQAGRHSRCRPLHSCVSIALCRIHHIRTYSIGTACTPCIPHTYDQSLLLSIHACTRSCTRHWISRLLRTRGGGSAHRPWLCLRPHRRAMNSPKMSIRRCTTYASTICIAVRSLWCTGVGRMSRWSGMRHRGAGWDDGSGWSGV